MRQYTLAQPLRCRGEEGAVAVESIPFGDAMGMPVAFCNALALDLSDVRRLIWVSGQIAFDERGELVGKGDVRAQTAQCLDNIGRCLEQLGGSMDEVVQVIVFVKEIVGLKEIHEVRHRYFKPPFPTSTLVAVRGFVHPDALIEINAVAAVRQPSVR
jgi:2-iminobutanoate/2-iminopropanoate deaminase